MRLVEAEGGGHDALGAAQRRIAAELPAWAVARFPDR